MRGKQLWMKASAETIEENELLMIIVAFLMQLLCSLALIFKIWISLKLNFRNMIKWGQNGAQLMRCRLKWNRKVYRGTHSRSSNTGGTCSSSFISYLLFPNPNQLVLPEGWKSQAIIFYPFPSIVRTTMVDLTNIVLDLVSIASEHIQSSPSPPVL